MNYLWNVSLINYVSFLALQTLKFRKIGNVRVDRAASSIFGSISNSAKVLRLIEKYFIISKQEK